MRFARPLVPGRLVRRYDRFLADVTLDDGRAVVAHCPNPGSMMGLKAPGLRVWLEPNDDPRRKLRFAWRVAELPGGVMVGIDTGVPNRVVKEALAARAIPGLADYASVRPEQRYGTGSRIDFLLEGPASGGGPCYVEVKNVHLLRTGTLAEFPDCVTARGTKHLHELATLARGGVRAVMLYVVQHTGCDAFALAEDIDPTYAAAFRAARADGVEMLCHACRVTPDEIALAGPLPIRA
ncbi:MAG: DNA/RNA nuclease SfsA [Shimia sp.]